MEIIDNRRYSGATLLILPKWRAVPLPGTVAGSRKSWVQLSESRRRPGPTIWRRPGSATCPIGR